MNKKEYNIIKKFIDVNLAYFKINFHIKKNTSVKCNMMSIKLQNFQTYCKICRNNICIKLLEAIFCCF